MKTHHQFFCLFLAVVLLTAIGCSKGWHGGERLYPVTITVTKDGVPFPGATVVLVREGGAQTINGGGNTNENGAAKIKVDAQWDGVPEGTYKVMINKGAVVERDISDEEYEKLSFTEKDTYNEKMAAKALSAPPLVPAVLMGLDSPLSIEVKSSGENAASFDIGKY